jgi:hypothetical protein
MMRRVAALLGFIIVGLPVVVTPFWIVVAPGALAAGLFAAGIMTLSLRLVSLGIAASLVEYTVALSLGARTLDSLTAVALGAAIVLLLQVVDLARRFRGAAVATAVIGSQIRYWVRLGILGVLLGLFVSALGTTLAPALPPPAYPVLGAAGAFTAVASVARLLLRRDAA